MHKEIYRKIEINRVMCRKGKDGEGCFNQGPKLGGCRVSHSNKLSTQFQSLFSTVDKSQPGPAFS